MDFHADRNPWIVRVKPNPGASCRLFCFPYAGAGASVYRKWQEGLPDHVEVCAVQPPGRESRFGETAAGDMDGLISALVPGLSGAMDRPFYFFGHSMGALTAFELTHRLREEGRPLPEYLFLSGRRAPAIRDERPLLHDLPDERFMEELTRFNGTPAAVLENRELMEIMLPILRSDFRIIENHSHRKKAPLALPLMVFGGRDDPRTPPDTLGPWEEETVSDFHLFVMEGDHFFIHDRREALLERIAGKMASHPGGARVRSASYY